MWFGSDTERRISPSNSGVRSARLGMVPELRTVDADPFFKDDPIWHVFVS